MMRRILLGMFVVLTAVYFTTAARADIALSGYVEYFAGSADQATASSVTDHGIDLGGFADGHYSRIMGSASSTLDNGIEATVNFTLAHDCTATSTANCNLSGPNRQDISFSGGFGTVNFGNTTTAGTFKHSRLTAGVPAGIPDGGYIGQFYTGGAGTYGGANEAGYAGNAMTVTWLSNSYDGFSFAGSYTPNMGENFTGDGDNGQDNSYTGGTFNDRTEAVVAYPGDFEGVGITATYGYIGGNAGTIAGVGYNDLQSDTISVVVSMGGLSVDHRWTDQSDSGRVTNDGSGGNNQNSSCGKYVTGPLSLGACIVQTNFDSSLTATNDREISSMSVGYNLGGGVTVSAAYFSVEETVDTTVQTDASGLVGKVQIGF